MLKNNKSKGADSILLAFHLFCSGTVTLSVAAFSVSPSGLSSFQTRLSAEADAWTKFRFRSLKFRIFPTGNGYTAAFVPGIQDTNTFASQAAASEVVPAANLTTSTSVPSEWIKVPDQDLRGVFPWYKSLAGGADSTEEAPGQFSIYSSAANGAYSIEIRGVIEFAGSVPPANTPEEVALLKALRARREREARERERAGILSVLSTASTSAVPSLPKC